MPAAGFLSGFLYNAPMGATDDVNLARQMIQMGRTPEAQAACRRALEADPNNADASYLLGMTLLQEGDPAAAAPHLTRAAAGYPNNSEVHANLGHTLRAIG